MPAREQPPPPPDSLPSELDPISDSNWNTLTEQERADHLRSRDELLYERHRQLVQSIASLRAIVSSQASAISAQARTTSRISARQDEQARLIAQGNEAAERTEKKIDDLVKNTQAVIDLYNDAASAGRFVGRIGEIGKKFAWVAVPSAAIYSAWKAAHAFIRSIGGP